MLTLICLNIFRQYSIHSLTDIQQETNKKIADLKKAFEVCKKKYEIYKDIADTYREITQGDYISKIIKKERVSNINKTKIL